MLTAEDLKLIDSNDPVDFLGMSAFQSTNLKAANDFVKVYLEWWRILNKKVYLRYWSLFKEHIHDNTTKK